MLRPSAYSPEIAADICDRTADGTFLRAICKSAGMPTWRTVNLWLEEVPEFAKLYAQAVRIGYDAIAQETMEIADTPLLGVTEKQEAVIVGTDGEGKPITEMQVVERKIDDMLGHRKFQVETRFKLLAKLDPKRYGEFMRQELSGPDGGPMQFQALPDEELNRKLAALMGNPELMGSIKTEGK